MSSLLGRLSGRLFTREAQCQAVPDRVAPLLASGLELHRAGRAGEALDRYREVLAVDAANFDALHLAGLAHQQLGNGDDALCMLADAVRRNPAHRDALLHLADLHAAREEWVEAMQVYRRLANLHSASIEAWAGLARAQSQLGDDDGAKASCAKALALDPQCHEALVQLGIARHREGDLAGAEAALRAALAAKPGAAVARYNLSWLVLRRDYREGFELYESRFDAVAGTPFDSPRLRDWMRDARRWQGEPLAGRRLAVWGEQGYGDVIMVLRYLPMLEAAGAGALCVQCEPALVRLVRTVAGVDEVVTDERRLDPSSYDVHCPIMSLPRLFGTTQDNIPDGAPYVAAPGDLVRRFAARLSGCARPVVGLAWASGSKLEAFRKRNIPLETLKPIVRPARSVVSLQKGEAARDASMFGNAVVDLMDECDDFLDTAALIANLDLVISVDTAVAHLAGALGKPAWVLIRHLGEWRWGAAGERAPWYRTMRVFRQRDAQRWDDTIAGVAHELTLVSAKAPR